MAGAGRQSSPHRGGAEPRGGSSRSGRRQASVRRAPPIPAATHRPRLGAPRPAPPPGWRPPRVHPTIVRAHSPAIPDGQASEQRVEESSQGIPHATGSASRARTVSQRQRTGTSCPSSILVLSSTARSTAIADRAHSAVSDRVHRFHLRMREPYIERRTLGRGRHCRQHAFGDPWQPQPGLAGSSNRDDDQLLPPQPCAGIRDGSRHSSRARDMHMVFATPPPHVKASRQKGSCDRQQHALARALRRPPDHGLEVPPSPDVACERGQLARPGPVRRGESSVTERGRRPTFVGAEARERGRETSSRSWMLEGAP